MKIHGLKRWISCLHGGSKLCVVYRYDVGLCGVVTEIVITLRLEKFTKANTKKNLIKCCYPLTLLHSERPKIVYNFGLSECNRVNLADFFFSVFLTAYEIKKSCILIDKGLMRETHDKKISRIFTITENAFWSKSIVYS